MIPANWTSLLANHLWQSTVVAALAALLTLALRKNQARIRYWIWLTASLKFLVPFSLVIALGHQLAWTPTGHLAIPAPQISAVMQQVTQPFPDWQAMTDTTVAATRHFNFLPIALGIWALGFFGVAFSWSRRWLRIRAALRAGTPLSIDASIPVVSSPTLLEPGIFGIFRQILVLPAGITDHLSREHLEAILAHELCHARRRDNLFAALHMAVEAVFWFHPLVWWIGSRLVEERERACDEEVLRLGNQPAIYAESILKTCQFYLESPLVCVAGITGSDLKKRIVRIMTESFTERLSFGRKLLLVGVAAVAIAAPLLFGLATQNQSQTANEGPLPTFEVASIKPNKSGTRMIRIGNTPGRFTAINVTPKMLIRFAYNIKDSQILGGPSWLDSEYFDIDAKTDEPDEAPGGNSSLMAGAGPNTKAIGRGPNNDGMSLMNERRRLMVQALLADRFKLTLDRQTKDLPIYELVVGKGGPKFKETTVAPPDPNEPPPGPPQPGQPPRRRGIMMGFSRGQLNMNGGSMSQLANALSERVGRTVVDKTGLTGEYDLTLQWTPDENDALTRSEAARAGGPGPSDAPAPDPNGPTLFTALQEQLGLKLESSKGPVQTFTITHIEQPSEN
jgi:uncharacterized protein (TIGR03435 family)